MQDMVDLVGLYRVFNPKYKNWTIFGQDFLAQHLLGWDTHSHSHDAVGDAIKSVQLFKLHQQLSVAGSDALAQAQVSGRLPLPPPRAVSCCAVLCCAVLFCAALCYAVLCCARPTPCCAVLSQRPGNTIRDFDV